MESIVVYVMEYPAVDLPVTIELTEKAAKEILETLRAIPKDLRDEHTQQLVKKLKKVLK
jgi:hypothetical protein